MILEIRCRLSVPTGKSGIDLNCEHLMYLWERIKTLLGGRKVAEELGALEPSHLEHLRAEFKRRYHSFNMLLTANNKALEIMTDVEGALRGLRPLGMGFVRSRCTRVSTNVFQMLKSLNELSPGKYEALYDNFVEIQNRITPLLSSAHPSGKGAWVIPLKGMDRAHADQVGYKMASLAELKSRLGLSIPNGFVVTAQAYRQFMAHQQLSTEIGELIQSAEPSTLSEWHQLSETITKKIESAPLPEGLAAVISRAYSHLEAEEGEGVSVAMRSSALGEDTPGVSFAGQYATEFNISGDSILQSYKRIIASKYRPQAIIYRRNHGIRGDDIAMCAGCMRVIDAVAGGVAYSRNPMNPNDTSVIIHSVWGLPKPVADGSVSSDQFVVSREGPLALVRQTVAAKSKAFRRIGETYRMVSVGEEAVQPSLTTEQVRELARVVLEIETHFDCPQDIEWALSQDGSFVLLQARPLHQTDLEPAASTEEKPIAPSSVILSGGTTASPGAGSGPVFVVRKDSDALQFPPGSVLVAAQALPVWATALNRASAVVTERGSIVGHLASVAREYHVPALFGVKGATRKLEKDCEVTVDADGCRVLTGHVESLVKRRRSPESYIINSPVYQSLKDASDHILPLRLLDPDSPSFKPENCTTFHDITRFCHEKAVQEMFRFGTEQSFPERSARQLHVGIPMQFWVIDLDDGFLEGTPVDRFIKLEQITSIPMLALWRGFTAIRWEGPPSVDTRGFMSVLAESTSDPSLDPTMRQKFGARNYFMISRNFCSLQSRFGYHFSTVEALVSERASENYISFQFKGGAANLQRRVNRARLVTEVLEEYGFRCELEEDCTRARLEGYEQIFMEMRLEILGHIILHTRQLDMVMNNPVSISTQKQRLTADLESVLSRKVH